MSLEQGSDWCWEDPGVREGDSVLASAEGGDRVLALLAAGPARIAAVDHRPPQLHLLELKLAALRGLRLGEYLELVGLRPSRRRRSLYQEIRWKLPRESDEFWLTRLGLVEGGVATRGRLERRVASFRRFVRLVQGRARVERFVTLRNEAARRSMYYAEWQSFLWRSFGPRLWHRWFEAPLANLERLLFEGRLLAPAPELQPGIFEAAKAYANRLMVVYQPPSAYLAALPDQSVDAFAHPSR